MIVRAATELFRRLFTRAAEEPLAWQSSADSLMRAARTLLPSIEADGRAASGPAATVFEPPVTPVYMLLVGLAMENLAKAVHVARRQSAVRGDRLANDLKTHSLLDLLRRVGLELDEDEAYLVERLEACVTWAGRYPIPLKLDAYLPRTHPSGGSGPLTGFHSSDPERVEALVERLTLTIESAHKRARGTAAQ
jgi:hypothetical protein